jgi:hypothetical protein
MFTVASAISFPNSEKSPICNLSSAPFRHLNVLCVYVLMQALCVYTLMYILYTKLYTTPIECYSIYINLDIKTKMF